MEHGELTQPDLYQEVFDYLRQDEVTQMDFIEWVQDKGHALPTGVVMLNSVTEDMFNEVRSHPQWGGF